MLVDAVRLGAVLDQTRIPSIMRRGKGHKLEVRLPYADDNRPWLQQRLKSAPVYDRAVRCWKLPANAFNKVVREILERFGAIYVIQPYQVHEVCAPACWNAEGHECQCSCMGANHGTGNSLGFFV